MLRLPTADPLHHLRDGAIGAGRDDQMVVRGHQRKCVDVNRMASCSLDDEPKQLFAIVIVPDDQPSVDPSRVDVDADVRDVDERSASHWMASGKAKSILA